MRPEEKPRPPVARDERGGIQDRATAGHPEHTPQQATLDEALAARDAGAKLAENSVHTSWRLAAEAVIAELAATGRPFVADDVTDRIGPPPGHHNAVGGLFISAAKRNEIIAIGFRTSTRRTRHAGVVRVWRGVG